MLCVIPIQDKKEQTYFVSYIQQNQQNQREEKPESRRIIFKIIFYTVNNSRFYFNYLKSRCLVQDGHLANFLLKRNSFLAGWGRE